jgi:hypothetical protein
MKKVSQMTNEKAEVYLIEEYQKFCIAPVRTIDELTIATNYMAISFAIQSVISQIFKSQECKHFEDFLNANGMSEEEMRPLYKKFLAISRAA